MKRIFMFHDRTRVYYVLLICIAAVFVSAPAKPEAPKTALLLECEQEWFADGKWVTKRVSVQIDPSKHRLFVAGWDEKGFGIWDVRDGVVEFNDPDNEWWGNMDRVTGEGAIWGKGIAHHSFKCKPAKGMF
jgi:hypothetical protein